MCKVVPTQDLLGTKFSSFPRTLRGIKIIRKSAFRFIKNFQKQRLKVSVGGFFQTA